MIEDVKTQWWDDEFNKALVKALFEAIDVSVVPILSEAKAKAPVDTGKLKASGRIIATERDSGEIYGRVIFDVDYAVFAEFDHPFLRPALFRNENRTLKNFEGRMDD